MKTIRLLCTLILIWSISVAASAAELLIPGGQIIGMELQDNTVTIAAFDDALGSCARSAGLKEGDRILQVNNATITCAEDIRAALSRSDGQVRIRISRNGKTKELTLFPAATSAGPRLGVYLKQGTTGVGTVTYYDPQSDRFAALGHGVNTPAGTLLEMTKGSVYAAQIQSVKKGKIGTPGQLMGALQGVQPVGTLQKNTAQGVFGTIEFTPKTEPLPVAQADEIRTGTATIRSTIQDQTLREYSVEIVKIYPNSPDRSRNMLLKVTDPALLTATGGIVQGMSGSPLVQDGKLIGAVTHVLVNDPTMGYGIFIENMLEAAG